jgi:lysophospholipid acyltransferase (LPLAT)-like uncharacterized protein
LIGARARSWAGLVLGLLVRLWAASWRVRLVLEPGAERAPRVLAFWHGAQMPLVAARSRRRAVAMISRSRDGDLSSGVMRSLGLVVVRGSSSCGGAAALRAVVRALGMGLDALFAVDGPRGPARRAKPGAAIAARLGGAAVVPVGSAASRATVLERAWDRFFIPWPFSRVVVVAGAPLDATEAAESPELVERAIARVEQRAQDLIRSAA